MAKKTKKTIAAEAKTEQKPSSVSESSPAIDTRQAAASVARMLLTKARLQHGAEPQTPGKESGAFKQLKESMTKHPSLAAANSLNTALGHSKSELPRSFNKSPGHGQVVGHAGPSNLPRRTNG
ncbi:MAG: hypothetical protein ABSH20_13995 [Tepidisphaeraceae bacterium]|jgi:hypothetical protein